VVLLAHNAFAGVGELNVKTIHAKKKRYFMRVFPFGCVVMVGFWLMGCDSKSIAQEFPKNPSSAIAQQDKTALGVALMDDVAAHPGQTGFRLLTTGSESFAMRLALIEAAEKTLDLQYYSIHDDTTANLLMEGVLRAARRGVRIRFLLDNINFKEVAETLSVLDGFRNVEIRIFNPFVTRHDGILTRAVRLVTDLGSINRRMHNKALIADNQMAITGGRNLGDEYFEENTDVTFRDIDILSAGPVTDKISQSFDIYWNGKDSYPIGQLKKPAIDPKNVEKIRAKLQDHWDEVLATEKGKKLLRSPLAERLKDGDIKLIWARAEFVVDTPQKIDKDRDEAESRPLMRLGDLLVNAKHEFVAVSPYFVPGDEGVEALGGLVKRGVKVKIVTNSLASTDVVAVHTGYRRYREAVVKNGVELYEMKPEGKRPRQRLLGKSAPASARLHAKAYVIDRSVLMVGSVNLDPRSLSLNTELALVIHSPELSAQVIRMFDEVTAPDSSYRIMLPENGAPGVVWRTTENKRQLDYTSEPKAGVWRNVEAGFIGLLPIEGQL